MTQYIERREKFIVEFINNVKTEYRNSPDFTQMIDRAIDLTIALQIAPCDSISETFVNDGLGFMNYAYNNPRITRSKVLTTIYHDLSEFQRNRDESWFSPRFSGYSKYLSGATKAIIN